MKCVVQRDEESYISGLAKAPQRQAFEYTPNIDEAKVFEDASIALTWVHKATPENNAIRAASLKLLPVSVITSVHPFGKEL